MAGGRSKSPILALVHAWLLLDFFGLARRSGGDSSTLTTTIFSQSFLALVIAALLYPDFPPVPFAAANLCISTLLVALGAFDSEQPAHRRVADRLLLGTSPVSRLQVVLARGGHVAFATMLVTVGMALPPAILLACRQGEFWLAPMYVLLACVSAGLATAALSLGLRAARRGLGAHPTALVAGTAKALVLAFGVVFFVLSMPALRRDADALPFGRFGAELLPPYHAARLLAFPVQDGWRWLVLLGAAAVLLGLALWLGEGERDRRQRVRRPGVLQRIGLRLSGDRPDAGLFAFTATMLWRSPGIRARVLPLLGVPAAFAFLALHGSSGRGRFLFTSMALHFPAIYLPFVIAMLQQADQQGSRWLFDSAPPIDLARCQRAVWLALVTHLLLPVHALAFAGLLLSGLPIERAVPASAFAFAAGAAVARVMARGLDDLPFSRDEPLGNVDLGGLLAFGLVLAGAGAVVALAPLPQQFAAAAAAWIALVILARPPRNPSFSTPDHAEAP